jgi:FHA domain/Double zinc ribbon
MITCSKCHGQSASLDYCDQCGAPLATGTLVAALPAAPAPQAACPNCKAHRDAEDVFCEICGYDFAAGTLPSMPTPVAPLTPTVSVAPKAWELVVTVDPARWEQQAALRSSSDSPPAAATVQLVTGSVSVGRTSRSRNVHPDLDLAALTLDPAVSHRHALLTLRADGMWEVVDLASENGTTRNSVVVKGQPAVLASGDRLDLGAWTTITILMRSSL